MSLYSSYSDDDLQAEIDGLKNRIIAAGKSDQAGVKVIHGEGRRVEFYRGGAIGDVASLERLLAAAESEWNKRNGCFGGGAIGVRF